jgi:hypothetical protein
MRYGETQKRKRRIKNENTTNTIDTDMIGGEVPKRAMGDIDVMTEVI